MTLRGCAVPLPVDCPSISTVPSKWVLPLHLRTEDRRDTNINVVSAYYFRQYHDKKEASLAQRVFVGFAMAASADPARPSLTWGR